LAINNFARRKTLATNVSPVSNQEKEMAGRETILQIDDYIFIKQNYQFTKVKLKEILFLEAANNYVNVFTINQKFTLRLTLNGVIERINYEKLVRTHRSYAINLEQIDSFNEHEIVMGKHNIPLGRNYKDEFIRYFDFL
jgi:DNA-binding LytR/AlgR family response regulator